MLPGKLSSQAGHAYTDALYACIDERPQDALAYRRNGHGGSKVTLKAKNERALRRAMDECRQAGIPHALVIDRDHVLLPHFDGSPVVTALGIGPVRRSEARHITKRFQCV